jgi:hypothetical protein
MELSPENLEAASVSSFIGSINIVGNKLTETNSHLYVEINNSFQGFTGIAQINQSAGSLNHQANFMGVTGSTGRGEITQFNLSNKNRVENNAINTSSNAYQANITGNAFAGGAGVAMVNQAAGNMNAQLNVFNLTVGSKRPLAAMGLTDIELGTVKANPLVTQDPSGPNKYSTKLSVEEGAFKNFTGVVNTNQVAGNMNQVTTVFNININTLP